MTSLPSKLRLCAAGQTVGLATRRLNAGGEGAIFRMEGAGWENHVAKIYHPRHRPDRAKVRKLIALANRGEKARPQNADDEFSLVWVTDLLAAKGEIVGSVMPMVPDHAPVSRIYHPVSRVDYRCPFTYWDLIAIAIGIARAVDEAHRLGIVIGDLNHNNFVVSPDRRVWLIDLDSAQLEHGGERFLCGVSMEEFLAPELQSADLSNTVREASSDVFSLGVLIYYFIFQGIHPYDGVAKRGGENRTRGGKIAGDLWHGGSKGRRHLRQPDQIADHLPQNLAGRELAALFGRTFSRKASRRPLPGDLVAALTAYRDSLIDCASELQHVYPRHLKSCPWCLARGRGGADYFPAELRPSAVSGFGMRGFREAIARHRTRRLAEISGSLQNLNRPDPASFHAAVKRRQQRTLANLHG